MSLMQLWQKRWPHSVWRGWHRTSLQASQQYLPSGVSTKWSLNPPWRGRKPAGTPKYRHNWVQNTLAQTQFGHLVNVWWTEVWLFTLWSSRVTWRPGIGWAVRGRDHWEGRGQGGRHLLEGNLHLPPVSTPARWHDLKGEEGIEHRGHRMFLYKEIDIKHLVWLVLGLTPVCTCSVEVNRGAWPMTESPVRWHVRHFEPTLVFW